MIGEHKDNRYYPEQGSQGYYYFNGEAEEGEVVYIPETAFGCKEFLEEGDDDLYTMADLRREARDRLVEVEGYDDLSEAQKSIEQDRLLTSFLEWCRDGEAWCYPSTYFDDVDVEFQEEV